MLTFDPDLDLRFERVVDVAKEAVWKAWTDPRHIVRWFTPAPWKTIDCAIDLHPGGRFYTVMQSPEGDAFPNEACYLDVLEHRRLVWTDALSRGFRPAVVPSGGFTMTAVIELSDHEGGTLYRATALHENKSAREQHAAMGFESGWGKALDQLVAMVKTW
jgi:uncharacterized protein YndB with AHSA1/START domain